VLTEHFNKQKSLVPFIKGTIYYTFKNRYRKSNNLETHHIIFDTNFINSIDLNNSIDFNKDKAIQVINESANANRSIKRGTETEIKLPTKLLIEELRTLETKAIARKYNLDYKQLLIRVNNLKKEIKTKYYESIN
jgi:hypothetical protein